MRIFATSDLHLDVDIRGDRAVKAMARHLLDIGTPDDILMLLGDLATSDQNIAQCLSYFSAFPGKKLVVAGNHDIWAFPEEGRDSVERYRQLTQICQRHGFILLDQESVVINGIGFAGTMGWYDYSFGDLLGATLEDYRTKTYPGESEPCWNDAHLAKWNFSDEEVVAQQLHYLHSQLDELEGVPVIVGLHHVPTKSLLFHPRQLVPAGWRFRNAFLGSQRFAELFAEYTDRITHVICGHIHCHSSVIEQGISYTSIGSDYKQKELLTLEPGKRTARRIFR